MEARRILELASQNLQAQKAALESQISEIRAELAGVAPTAETVTPPAGNRRKRSAAERRAQSRAMKLYWKRRKAEAAEREIRKSRPAASRTGRLSPAARKAISLKMRAYWMRRKASGKNK